MDINNITYVIYGRQNGNFTNLARCSTNKYAEKLAYEYLPNYGPIRVVKYYEPVNGKPRKEIFFEVSKNDGNRNNDVKTSSRQTKNTNNKKNKKPSKEKQMANQYCYMVVSFFILFCGIFIIRAIIF